MSDQIQLGSHCKQQNGPVNQDPVAFNKIGTLTLKRQMVCLSQSKRTSLSTPMKIVKYSASGPDKSSTLMTSGSAASASIRLNANLSGPKRKLPSNSTKHLNLGQYVQFPPLQSHTCLAATTSGASLPQTVPAKKTA